MLVPDPKTWTAGLWSAGEANRYIRDVATFFMNVPMCILRKDRQETKLIGVDSIYIEFDSVVYDNDNIFANSSDGDIKIQTPGVYTINWQAQWKHLNGSDDVIYRMNVEHFNASGVSQIFYQVYQNYPGDTDESHTVQLMLRMDEGHYLRFSVATFGSWDSDHKVCRYDLANSEYGMQAELRWIRPL